MALVGFNFTRVTGQRTGELKGKINVSNNVVLKGVKKSEIGLSLEKEQGIEVEFLFTSTYSPEVGKIELGGKILLLEPKSEAESILSGWEKTKRLPPRLMEQVFSTVLRKCNIQAIVLSEDIGLPSPVRLPEVHLAHKAPAEKSQPAKPVKQPEQKKPEVQKKFSKI
jgi:hypothetical protein